MTLLALWLCLCNFLPAQVQVRLRVVDQFQQDIPGCSLRVGSATYANSAVASLALGSYTFEINMPLNGGLGRTETATVTASTTELAFEWITSVVRFRIRDQHSIDIQGSTVEISQLGSQRFVPTGDTRILPITDPTVYPTSYGMFRDGYQCGLLVAQHLSRPESGVRVLASTTEIAFEWITSVVRFRIRDQHGVDIQGSQVEISEFWFNRFVPTGDTRVMPITDPTVYPTSTGSFRDGYLCNLGVAQHLGRPESGVRVLASTTEIAFEWITSVVRFRVRDQHGVDIQGSTVEISEFWFNRFVPTGDTRVMAITDPGVYPTSYGMFRNGYLCNLFLPGGNLGRSVTGVSVLATTTEAAFEWIVHGCPLQVVNAAGALVPNSSLLLPSPYASFQIGQTIHLPITDNSVYPALFGAHVNGFPIRVTPGDIAPANATFEFELLVSGTFLPATFVIAGNTYSLVCQANRPPVADAGTNVAIPSSTQASTTIQGTAFDPDNDAMTYRWLEGLAVLFGPASVGASGSAPLNLGSLPPLGLGNHSLTLEVSDGQSTVTSGMLLAVGNSPPTVNASGSGTYQLGIDAVQLTATVADFDGDALTYRWSEGSLVFASGVVFPVAGAIPLPLPISTLTTGSVGADLAAGNHVVTLTVGDGVNPDAIATVVANVVDTQAPRLAPVSSVAVLWPPNHQMVNVTIQANAMDASAGPVFLTAVVASSEDAQKDGSGNTVPDFTAPIIDQVHGTIALQLRAERSGRGPGRVYSITVTATDLASNQSSAVVQVIAPHNMN